MIAVIVCRFDVMNKSVCDVLSVQHGARKRRVRWTQGDGFPIRAVNDVEVRNAPFDDGSVDAPDG